MFSNVSRSSDGKPPPVTRKRRKVSPLLQLSNFFAQTTLKSSFSLTWFRMSVGAIIKRGLLTVKRKRWHRARKSSGSLTREGAVPIVSVLYFSRSATVISKLFDGLNYLFAQCRRKQRDVVSRSNKSTSYFIESKRVLRKSSHSINIVSPIVCKI